MFLKVSIEPLPARGDKLTCYFTMHTLAIKKDFEVKKGEDERLMKTG